MRFCNKQSGVSLIEIMTVIGIMGIVASIAIPNYIAWLPTAKLNGAARQVMGDLMAARMKAVSLNCDVAVTFASGNPEYEIWTDSDNDDIEDSGEVITKNIQSNYHYVTIVSNNDPIFSPRGTVTNLPTITLTNASGSKDITISIAGRVKINW